MPLALIATFVWALLRLGRSGVGLRIARRLFFADVPDGLADPATVERIRATYDTILTVVVGIAAPAFGLMTAVVTLLLACIGATIGGLRARRAAMAAH